jgi:hypothetical protein
LLTTSSLDEWASHRHDFWLDVDGLPVDTVASHLLPDLRSLNEASTITLWLGNGLEDQITLPWLCWVLRLAGIDHGRVRLVQFPQDFNARGHTPSIEILTPKQILQHPPALGLSAEDLSTIDSAWQALTSSMPQPLRDFVCSQPDELPLRRALARLARRYPQHDTGLSHWDHLLLSNTSHFGPKAASIVGHTLSGAGLDTDSIGDIWLLWRLRRLADSSLEHPLVALEGDPSELRDLSVRMTEAGQRVVSAAVNAVELNGIDDWIGGVHLDSSSNRVWFTKDGHVIC